MIERLEGELLEVGPGHLLVNLGGLGVRVLVPKPVAQQFEGRDRGVLWTRLLVRDGEPQLYGFLDQDERTCFDALLAVSGVGPRIGLAILSFLDPASLAMEAERGATERLIVVPGVGRKLAGRIVLELKGKLPVAVAAPSGSGDAMGLTELGFDAVRALTALGYPPGEAREAVHAALRGYAGGTPALDDLLREALVGLNRGRG